MQAGLQAKAIGQSNSSLYQLTEGATVRLGRSPNNAVQVPWDMAISREHADVSFQNGHLRVRCLEAARNPISYNGKRMREAILPAGDAFQIGATVFRVIHPDDDGPEESRETLPVEEQLFSEHAFSPDELKRVHFEHADQQLEVLARLPQLIAVSTTDEEFAGLLVRLLMEAIPQAEAAAVVQFDGQSLEWDKTADTTDTCVSTPRILQVDTRDGFSERFRPSQRLMMRALQSRESVIHIWDEDASSAQFTVCGELGWAFCAPVNGESCRGWCLYVSGKGSRNGSLLMTENDLKGDLRFTELVAQFIGSVRQVRVLEEQKTQLSSFFSPKVIENLTSRHSSDTLEPAEREITVLFCDVRGFSKKSEQLQGDLRALLQTVSEALGVMTAGVIERDGAIADFQGDAVLGFWGWPVEHQEGPLPACRAALAIHQAFEEAVNGVNPLLAGFSVGIGITHGTALAGQIGTRRQAKVGVFGPVVNQGSRLEGLTKKFGVPICVDRQTAELIQPRLAETDGRLMRLAQVRPAGMETALDVYALLPPHDQLPQVTAESISAYENALEKLIRGDWSQAAAIVTQLPDNDGPAQFLRAFLAENGIHPPHSWDGVISIDRK